MIALTYVAQVVGIVGALWAGYQLLIHDEW